MIYSKKLNRKKDLLSKKDGCYRLRIWHKKSRGKHLPVVTVKCGDCNESLRIEYDHEKEIPTLEINGVFGTVEMWEEILLPLLQIEDGK